MKFYKMVPAIFLFLITIFFSCSKSNPKKILSNDKTQDSEVYGQIVIPVRTLTVKYDKIGEILELQGDIESKEFALISAKVSGPLEKLYVHQGDYVKKGITKLFKIESENLENNFKIQKNNLEVAKYALTETKAHLELTKASAEKISIDYNRAKRLYKKNVITKDVFEKQETGYKQSLASVKYAEAQVNLAKKKVLQAEAGLEIAAKGLEDAEVTAPIDGYISKRYFELGELVKYAQPVFRIDNTSILELSAYLPAKYYSKIKAGHTRMDIRIDDVNFSDMNVSYKSPTIDKTLRTFEIKTNIVNENFKIAPGNIADIKVYATETKQAFVVPYSAVLKENNAAYIFCVQDGKAKKIRIKSGAEYDGKIEISSDDIMEGMSIIIEGQSTVKEGSPVKVL